MIVKDAPTGIVGLAGYLTRNPLQDPGKISITDRKVARQIWGDILREYGFSGTPTRLLTPPGANQKIAKSVRLVWSLTLAPAASSAEFNTCVRFKDCADVCVLTSGKGAIPATQRVRNARTALLYRAPGAFAVLVADEIDRAAREAGGSSWGMRLNAASDIPWEDAAPWMIERVVSLGGLCYDYTKNLRRVGRTGYSLTYSADSRFDTDHGMDLARHIIKWGDNIAVVLDIKKGEPVPSTWRGMPAIDGDVSDSRCDDPWGVVVILRAKGKLRNNPTHPLVRSI